tara:strand:+ start:6135 stop:6467 length:333 start_codon:yes stop_codon:yes gene_type:complete
MGNQDRFCQRLEASLGIRLVLSLVIGLGLTGSTQADALDQDEVLTLIKQGDVLPLETLLQRHRERLQGRLIDLELEHEQGRWLYELELIDSQGIVREYKVDAKSGEWLGR